MYIQPGFISPADRRTKVTTSRRCDTTRSGQNKKDLYKASPQDLLSLLLTTTDLIISSKCATPA